MSHDNTLAAILVQLTRIADALNAGGSVAVTQGDVPASPYAAPPDTLPAGYDTVLGYFSRELPDAFDLIDDPISGTQTDGFWCKHQAARRGLRIVRVPAPEVLRQQGIDMINAYPVSLLAERFGIN